MNKTEPSFEQAINTAAIWCTAWEEGELSDEVIADRIAELVVNKEGARGFFAFALAGDCPILDHLPDPLVIQLRAVGKDIVDLTVRNLAMSSAMALQHQRDSNKNQQMGSERIIRRCIELLRLLEPNLVKGRLEQLLEGLKGDGKDVNFLKRWGYDKEQKMAIENSLNAVAIYK